MANRDFKYIDDKDIIGQMATKVRTYRLISSGRYSWDVIKFNEEVATKWLSYGSLELNDTIEREYSVYVKNAIHYYAKYMDKFRVGDIIKLCKKTPFEHSDYVLLDDDIVIDDYSVGCHMQKLELKSPYDYMHIDRTILGESLDDMPVVDVYVWFDFMTYYSPKLIKFNKYKKDKLSEYSSKIKDCQENIRFYEKSIDILRSDMKNFSKKFRDYIKHIRKTGSVE